MMSLQDWEGGGVGGGVVAVTAHWRTQRIGDTKAEKGETMLQRFFYYI